MAQAPAELAVIARSNDLLVWASQHIARFPRSHCFTVGQRLESQLYLVLDRLLRAKYTRDRGPLLRAVNLELEIARFQLRLAHDLKCLTRDHFGFAARSMQAIGQMVGGWLRSCGGGPAPGASS